MEGRAWGEERREGRGRMEGGEGDRRWSSGAGEGPGGGFPGLGPLVVLGEDACPSPQAAGAKVYTVFPP